MTSFENHAGLAALATCIILSCEVNAQMITNKKSMDTTRNSRLQYHSLQRLPECQRRQVGFGLKKFTERL